MKALLEPVVRALYPRGSVRRVVRGPLAGMRFVVKPGMGATYALTPAAYGFHLYDGLVKHGDVVYDVGSNAGQLALYFARKTGTRGSVFAFEPVPVTCAELRRNVALNSLAHVVVVEAALAAKIGTATFDFLPERDTQGKLAEVETTYQVAGATRLTVATTSLDAFVDQGHPPPAFMKIDTEGAAGVVLEGGRHVLAKAQPTILLELHGPEEQRAVDEHLVGRGWKLTDARGAAVASASAQWTSPLVARKR